MTPLEGAVALVMDEISTYSPGSAASPLPGSVGYYHLRSLVVAHAYLLRIQSLGIENDPAACERLYRQGTIHFGKAAVPAEEVVVPEKLTPEQQAAVAGVVASGNL